MRHGQAKRRLLELPDQSLAPEEEAQVRQHLSGCRRCQRRFRKIELTEHLLRGIPASVLPLQWSVHSYTRLSRLSRWSLAPELPDPERWRVPALGVAGVLATLLMAFGASSWDVTLVSPLNPIDLSHAPPESALLAANGSSIRF